MDRYCCSVNRRVSSVRCRSIADAQRTGRRAQRAGLHVGPAALVATWSNPRNPHHSEPRKTGTAKTLATPSPVSTRRSTSGSSLTHPWTSPRRPSTSIQREKSGAYGCRWFAGSSKIWPTTVGVPFEAEVHPQASVGTARVLEEVGARDGRGAYRGARAPHRSDRARPRPARSARLRTRRLRGRPLRFRPEPPSHSVLSAKLGPVCRPRRRGREGACYPWRTMPDYKEVLHERLYVRVPGTDKLRKTAAARLKHLLANGWRETDRRRPPTT